MAGVVTTGVFAVWFLVDPSGVNPSIADSEATQPRLFGGLIDQVKEQVAGAQAAIKAELPTEEVTAPTSTSASTQFEAPSSASSSATTSTTTSSTTNSQSPREIQLYIEPSSATSSTSL